MGKILPAHGRLHLRWAAAGDVASARILFTMKMISP